MIEKDSGLDYTVNVERGAAIGGTVVVFDLFDSIFFEVVFAPDGFVRDRCAIRGEAVYDEDGAGSRI